VVAAPAESCAVAAVRERCGPDEARGLERLHGAYVAASTGRDLALIDLASCLASGARAERVEAADAAVADAELAACREEQRDGPPWWTVPAALVVGAVAGTAAVAW